MMGDASPASSKVLECPGAPCREHGNRSEQLFQLYRATGVEGKIGTPRELGQLCEYPSRKSIATFVKDEDLHTDDAQLSCEMAKRVRVLFHAVAHEDQGSHSMRFVLRQCMLKHLLNLRVTASARDCRHLLE